MADPEFKVHMRQGAKGTPPLLTLIWARQAFDSLGTNVNAPGNLCASFMNMAGGSLIGIKSGTIPN
jgi:hypothetical protein